MEENKKDVLLSLLEHGLIMMHMDARHPDIEVPEYLKGDPNLCLNLSYRFGIPDLEITDTEITATLSFQKVPFQCTLPMDAIWGISQPPEPGMQLFFDALPPELLVQMMEDQIEELGQQMKESTDSSSVQPLRAVPDLKPISTEAPSSSEVPTSSPSEKTKRPALRLVVDNSEDPPPKPEETPSTRSHLRVVPAPTQTTEEATSDASSEETESTED